MNLTHISKKVAYLFLFLLPFFFIPNLAISPVMNLKAIALVFALVLFSLFFITVVKNRENSLNFGTSTKIILAFLVFAAVSLFVSGYLFQGYWGYPVQSDSLFCFIVFSIAFFLFGNIFKQDNREKAYRAFTCGAFFLALLYLFQIFLGSKMQLQMVLPVNAEASIIFALGLIFSIYYIFKNFDFKKSKENMLQLAFATVAIVVFIIMLYLMGTKLGWFLSSVGAFFLFWRGLQKRDFDFNYPEPFISFLFVLFFLVNFLLPLNDLPILKPYAYSEPMITYDQSINIISKSLNDTKNIIFGTGPSSFPYNFSLNKGSDFGTDENIPNHPNSGFLMIVNDFGIVGALLFLALALFFVWKAIIFMVKSEEKDSDDLLFISSVFMLFLAFFLYRFSFTVTLLLFVFLGLYFSNTKRYELSGAKNNAYRIIVTIALLALLPNLYFFVQYQAEQKYQTFIMLSSENSKYKEIFTENQSLDNYIKLLDEAHKMFPNPDYAIYLSKAYLSKSIITYDDFFNSDGQAESSEEIKKKSFEYLTRAETYAKNAIAMNERNYFAWENLGMIYESAEKIDSSKEGQAISAYQKAMDLAPYNYETYVLMGRKLEKDGKVEEALKQYKKGLELNPDFVELEEVINSLEKTK
ncbi:MAG: hypothetical protein WCX74_02425 [Candidatus Paceibacterota bacterium]